METIEKLRELLAKAEWARDWQHNIVPPGKPAHELACSTVRALPTLLDELERLQKENGRMRDAVQQIQLIVEEEAYKVTAGQPKCRHVDALNEIHETTRAALQGAADV